MNTYRTHYCSDLSIQNLDQDVVLSGWIDTMRDHGNLLFIDLRDNYGITQCVVDSSNPNFEQINALNHETVIKITGKVLKRSSDTINTSLKTGEIEIVIKAFEILSKSDILPLPVNSDIEYGEEVRLKYRYLDLRRNKLHKNILLRNKVISSIRTKMLKRGFIEFQTPILTSTSPEGARDYLVPSRIHQGKFYALPQAPQQFKQMVMISGFDKYFQIAPCFRDEDARADRSPGEFYQLDLEMSFVEQEDVFEVVEKLMINLFKKFSTKKKIYEKFPRIKFSDAMMKYGTDKPDLRNPLLINDITDIFKRSDVKFEIFKKLIKSGSIVRAIVVKNTKEKPRSFFDKIDNWAKEQGTSGLAYFTIEKDKEIIGKGPVGKFFASGAIKEIMKLTSAEVGDSIFLSCGNIPDVQKILSQARHKIASDLNLIDKNSFAFCWVVDYPMFEKDELTKKIKFSHNPFSMPQGNVNNLDLSKPLELKAYQYDIVCNGVELSSGAIRNHIPELMYKLFAIAGYNKKIVNEKFKGIISALSYGAPPHGGIAPGIDRIVMLLAEEKNIREVIMFPMNQNAQDLLMNAPSDVSDEQLKELNLAIKKK